LDANLGIFHAFSFAGILSRTGNGTNIQYPKNTGTNLRNNGNCIRYPISAPMSTAVVLPSTGGWKACEVKAEKAILKRRAADISIMRSLLGLGYRPGVIA